MTYAIEYTKRDGGKDYDFCHSERSIEDVRRHFATLIARACGEFAAFVSVDVQPA